MSKAFTKDDAEDAPQLLPRRAPLPAGVTNYVTASGLAALEAELSELLRGRAELSSTPEAERAEPLSVLAARIGELSQRLASATLVPAPEHAPPEARFGATVRVRSSAGVLRSYRIVGVDEANAGAGRIAFVAPLARALLGKRVGETALLSTPAGEEELELVAVDYDGAPPA